MTANSTDGLVKDIDGFLGIITSLPSSKFKTGLTELLRHLKTLKENELSWLQRMDAKVSQLAFATPAAQDLVRADISHLPFAAEKERDKIMDRLYRALVNKPPGEKPSENSEREIVRVGATELSLPRMPESLKTRLSG